MRDPFASSPVMRRMRCDPCDGKIAEQSTVSACVFPHVAHETVLVENAAIKWRARRAIRLLLECMDVLPRTCLEACLLPFNSQLAYTIVISRTGLWP